MDSFPKPAPYGWRIFSGPVQVIGANGVNLQIDAAGNWSSPAGTVPGSLINSGAVGVGFGGTGAQNAASARTNLGLVAVASSGSASDLTTGTLANARLPATISITGSMTAGSFNVSSDERLKKDIYTIHGALEKVAALRGVRFEWKASGEKAIGVIAQEVAQVIPEVVSQSDDTEYLAVAYGNLIGLLIEAVKELTQRVEAIE